jgi:hypothetical protein
MADELSTRVIPYAPVEGAYARNRNLDERTPVPAVGDTVYYRHNEWDAEVVEAEVLAVQSMDDLHDVNLWRLVRDNLTGAPVYDNGQPRMVKVEDPWPWVMLKPEGHPTTQTWEARLRGSAGWLPLDYRERPLRLPGEIVIQPTPNRNW